MFSLITNCGNASNYAIINGARPAYVQVVQVPGLAVHPESGCAIRRSTGQFVGSIVPYVETDKDQGTTHPDQAEQTVCLESVTIPERLASRFWIYERWHPG